MLGGVFSRVFVLLITFLTSQDAGESLSVGTQNGTGTLGDDL